MSCATGMANIIMCLYPIIHSMEDKSGVTPLEMLATRTSAFKSGNKLSWFKELLYKYCKWRTHTYIVFFMHIWGIKTKIFFKKLN